jgi:DNA relaxase NicK
MLLEAIIRQTPGICEVQEGPGRFNYRQRLDVTQGGDRVATILHGGSNGHPNVEASGDRAPALAELLRASGAHRVTRCDIAIDGHGAQLFAELEAAALGIAGQHGLQVRKIANPLDRSAGETVYLGSRSSSVFARIYEKGKAERQAYGGERTDALDSWVRCELEVKPQKDMKAVAASMAPEAFWGVSDWTAQLASECFALSPAPIDFHPRRIASDDRAFATMCQQYRNLLRRRCQLKHQGSKIGLAEEIVARVFEEMDWEDEGEPHEQRASASRPS